MQHEADFFINLKNREWFQTSGTIPDFSSAQPLLPPTPSAKDISSVYIMLHHVIYKKPLHSRTMQGDSILSLFLQIRTHTVLVENVFRSIDDKCAVRNHRSGLIQIIIVIFILGPACDHYSL